MSKLPWSTNPDVNPCCCDCCMYPADEYGVGYDASDLPETLTARLTTGPDVAMTKGTGAVYDADAAVYWPPVTAAPGPGGEPPPMQWFRVVRRQGAGVWLWALTYRYDDGATWHDATTGWVCLLHDAPPTKWLLDDFLGIYTVASGGHSFTVNRVSACRWESAGWGPGVVNGAAVLYGVSGFGATIYVSGLPNSGSKPDTSSPDGNYPSHTIGFPTITVT